MLFHGAGPGIVSTARQAKAKALSLDSLHSLGMTISWAIRWNAAENQCAANGRQLVVTVRLMFSALAPM